MRNVAYAIAHSLKQRNARQWVAVVATSVAVNVLPERASRNAEAQPSTIACTATVYLSDPDPRGTNVRDAAGSRSRVIATLMDSDSQLDIVGASDNWLRVRQVRSASGQVTFKGDGWVFASLTAVRARGAAMLRATPNGTGAIVEQLRDEDELRLVSCRGEWLQVQHRTNRGWIGRKARCANPVTTCA